MPCALQAPTVFLRWSVSEKVSQHPLRDLLGAPLRVSTSASRAWRDCCRSSERNLWEYPPLKEELGKIGKHSNPQNRANIRQKY